MRLKGRIILMLCLMEFFLQGCSAIFPDRTAPKSKMYEIEELQKPWVPVPVGESTDSIDALKADIAYENPNTGAIISINSICRKYTNTTLEDMTNNLVRGIENRTILTTKSRSIVGNEARDSLFEGFVDGVKINLRTIVMISSDCSYDFIFVTPHPENSPDSATFEHFLESFKFGAKK